MPLNFFSPKISRKEFQLLSSTQIPINNCYNTFINTSGTFDFEWNTFVLDSLKEISCNTTVTLLGTFIRDTPSTNLILNSEIVTLRYLGQKTWKILKRNDLSSGSLISPVSTFVPQMLNVNLGGNDSVADGSLNKPFGTITGALNFISDNSSSKRYMILIGPGNYTEPGFLLKPYVHIRGSGFHTRLTLSSNIGINSIFNGTNGRTGLFDMLISGSNNGLNFDLQTISGNSSCVIEMSNVHVNGTLDWKARSSADVFEIWNCQFLSNVTLSGGDGLMKNCYIPVQVTINNNGCLDPNNSISFENSNVDSLIISSTSVTLNVSYIGAYITLVNLSGAGSTLTTDSLPDNFTFTSGNLKFLNYCKGTGYDPGNSSKWSVVPNNVYSALEIISNRLYQLNGNSAI